MKIALALGHRGLLDLASSDVTWDEIVSIEATGEKQVYDLTIPETHNFVANDVCVHNTAFSLGLATHAGPGNKRSRDFSCHQFPVLRCITVNAGKAIYKGIEAEGEADVWFGEALAYERGAGIALWRVRAKGFGWLERLYDWWAEAERVEPELDASGIRARVVTPRGELVSLTDMPKDLILPLRG